MLNKIAFCLTKIEEARMGGCRRLTDEEVSAVFEKLGLNRYPARDRALFLLGIRSGFRISELLSLKIGQVYQNGQVSRYVSVERKHMKKKLSGRTVVLHPEAKAALESWISELKKEGELLPTDPLFKSQEKGKALSRIMAWVILKKAYVLCGLDGKLATHSMRKTFAQKVHKNLGGDIFKTQKALGHASLNSTASYLEVNQEEIDDAILKP
jgi:site-specific recombinase XerD